MTLCAGDVIVAIYGGGEAIADGVPREEGRQMLERRLLALDPFETLVVHFMLTLGRCGVLMPAEADQVAAALGVAPEQVSGRYPAMIDKLNALAA